MSLTKGELIEVQQKENNGKSTDPCIFYQTEQLLTTCSQDGGLAAEQITPLQAGHLPPTSKKSAKRHRLLPPLP